MRLRRKQTQVVVGAVAVGLAGVGLATAGGISRAADAASPEPQPVESPIDPVGEVLMEGAYGDVVDELLVEYTTDLGSCMADAGFPLLDPDEPPPDNWDDEDALAYEAALVGDPEDPEDLGCSGPATDAYMQAVEELDALIAQGTAEQGARARMAGGELDAWTVCMDAAGFDQFAHPDEAGEAATTEIEDVPDLPVVTDDELEPEEETELIEDTAGALEARDEAEEAALAIDVANTSCMDSSGLAASIADDINSIIESTPGTELTSIVGGD